jgi:hypothetical protein
MKQILLAMMLLPMLAPVAQARPIDWQAELDRCRAMREQMEPLLLAGKACLPSRGPERRRALRLDRAAGAETWRTLGAVSYVCR